MQIPGEALLPARWLRKVGFVAAGALGIRGDSQNPGDGTGDAGKVPHPHPQWPAAGCGLGAFLAGRMALFQEPKVWDLQKGVPGD